MKRMLIWLMVLAMAASAWTAGAEEAPEQAAAVLTLQDWLERARRDAARVRDVEMRGLAYAVISAAAADAGEMELFEQALSRAERAAERLDGRASNYVRRATVSSYVRAGQLERAVEAAERIPCTGCRAVGTAWAAMSAAVRKQEEAYEMLLAQALEAVPSITSASEKDDAIYASVAALAEARDYDTSRELAMLGSNGFRRAQSLGALAWVRGMAGDAEEAEALLKQAAEELEQGERAEEGRTVRDRDRALYAIGAAQALLGRSEEAVNTAERTVWPGTRAHVLAVVAGAARREGEADRARELLAEALELALVEGDDQARAGGIQWVFRLAAMGGLIEPGDGTAERIEQLATPLERALSAVSIAEGLMAKERMGW